MEMQKQIEEIKECIDSVYGCDCAYFGVDGLAIAAAIYNADYRKQAEGEWLAYPSDSYMKCSVCGMEYPRSRMPHTVGYCPNPNCGAKMKGEDHANH